MSTQDLDLLTIREVAALFKVSVRTVYGWMDSGRLASLKMGPDHNSPRRIERSAVEAFIDQFRQEQLVS